MGNAKLVVRIVFTRLMRRNVCVIQGSLGLGGFVLCVILGRDIMGRIVCVILGFLGIGINVRNAMLLAVNVQDLKQTNANLAPMCP